MLTKEGRFLSLRSAWGRDNLGPGIVGMLLSGPSPTQLPYCLGLTEADGPLNSSAMLKENVCLLSPKN